MEQEHKVEHDRLRILIEAYVALLRPDHPPNIDTIMRPRLAIAHAYRAHVANEGQVFQSLRTGKADDPVDRLLDEHAAMFRPVKEGYATLVRDWTPKRIAGSWSGYCQEVKALMRRHYAVLEWEEDHVLPLLDRLSGERALAQN